MDECLALHGVPETLRLEPGLPGRPHLPRGGAERAGEAQAFPPTQPAVSVNLEPFPDREPASPSEPPGSSTNSKPTASRYSAISRGKAHTESNPGAALKRIQSLHVRPFPPRRTSWSRKPRPDVPLDAELVLAPGLETGEGASSRGPCLLCQGPGGPQPGSGRGHAVRTPRFAE